MDQVDRKLRIEGVAMILSVDVAENSVVLHNKSTNSAWRLEPGTCLADVSGQDSPLFGPAGTRHLPAWESNDTDTTFPLRLTSAEPLGVAEAVLTFCGSGGRLVTRWEMRSEGLEITALAGVSTVLAVSLPGSFQPPSGRSEALVPLCQGIRHRDCGAAFDFNVFRSGHVGWTMPFAALCGEREALLQIAVDEHDARLWFGRRGTDGFTLSWLQDPSRGSLNYDRRVLLNFTEPTAVDVARFYRAYLKRHGNFTTWDEKLIKRPALEKIFGALMCFIGYCRDDTIDYGARFRKLKAMGFDRAFVYPLSIANPAESVMMAGREAIDIRDQVGVLHELGYVPASWIWTDDVPPAFKDDLLLNKRGEPFMSWQIDSEKWFKSCPVRGVALANRILEARLEGHDGQHFDVTASRRSMECYHPDHPMDRRDDARWRRRVLATAVARGQVVSSEGFWGYATPDYDIGSVKIPIAMHENWHTIPLTSLVYHDSCIHDWWEVDGYNSPYARGGGRSKAYFPLGGGWASDQAAQDALAGWPPNVFPFGAQYKFVEGHEPQTELYRFDLEMPEVVNALNLALPVARLHRRIGRVACVDHRLHASDGSLQQTTFEDGTSVFANFGDQPAELAGFSLPPKAWRAVAENDD